VKTQHLVSVRQAHPYLAGDDLGRKLMDLGLLVERQADMHFPDDNRYVLNGFMVVDPLKFRAISDSASVVDWHQKGWLAAVELHLASANNWQALLLLNAEKHTEQGAI